MSNDNKNPLIWIIGGAFAVIGTVGAWVWDHKTTKERGITEGEQNGYDEASKEYKDKLLRQADEFLKQKRFCQDQLEELKEIIEYLRQELLQYKDQDSLYSQKVQRLYNKAVSINETCIINKENI